MQTNERNSCSFANDIRHGDTPENPQPASYLHLASTIRSATRTKLVSCVETGAIGNSATCEIEESAPPDDDPQKMTVANWSEAEPGEVVRTSVPGSEPRPEPNVCHSPPKARKGSEK